MQPRIRSGHTFMGAGTKNGAQRFQAEIGGRSIDLVIEDGHVSIDDERMPYSFEKMSDGRIFIILNGRSIPAVVLKEGRDRYRVHVEGCDFDVHLKDEKALLLQRFGLADRAGAGVQEIRAPMPGLVLSVAVEPGSAVREGAGLVVLEAMKMENEIQAAHEGVVRTVHVVPGDAVRKNDLLLEIE